MRELRRRLRDVFLRGGMRARVFAGVLLRTGVRPRVLLRLVDRVRPFVRSVRARILRLIKRVRSLRRRRRVLAIVRPGRVREPGDAPVPPRRRLRLWELRLRLRVRRRPVADDARCPGRL